MPLVVIYMTLNKKIFLRVFDLENLCSPEMLSRGMVINIYWCIGSKYSMILTFV